MRRNKTAIVENAHGLVPPQVQKCFFKVLGRQFIARKEEIGDTALEVAEEVKI